MEMMDQARESWRVVLFTDAAGMAVTGMDELLRAHGHRLVGVVTSPGPRARRSRTYLDVVQAARPGIDVIVSNHPSRWAAMLAPLRPDLIISMGFLWMIPEEVISLPRLGAYNTHGGLLPRGRGPNPTGWAFRNDEGELGWTIHRLDTGLDTGPILAQGRVPYTDDQDMDDLFPAWTGLIFDLWSEALDKIARGVEPVPQDESRAYYAGLFDEAWREIDWAEPARAIHNKVRSLGGGRPGMQRGAFATIDGDRVIVTKTRLCAGDANGSTPGTVLNRDDGEIVIQCGDGPLRVLAWEAIDPAPEDDRSPRRTG